MDQTSRDAAPAAKNPVDLTFKLWFIDEGNVSVTRLSNGDLNFWFSLGGGPRYAYIPAEHVKAFQQNLNRLLNG
jgi:hypothetical protein